jgi:hypothetical protein
VTPDGLLNGDDIKRLVSEVAVELGPLSPQRTLVIVGGSLLAWHDLREATQDVDTILRLDEELKSAVAVVAARHELSVSWLNDHAAAFRPSTFAHERCDLLLEHPALLVLGLPLPDVFLMKLRRADPADLNDMRALWPHVSEDFATARHIVAAFYAAFPHEPADEYLAELVIAELARGGIDLPLV